MKTNSYFTTQKKKTVTVRDGRVIVSDDRWITINADEETGRKGQHVLIKENGSIVYGLGGKFKHLSDLKKKGKGLKNPAPKYIKEVREEEHYFRGRKRDSFVYVHNDGTEFFFPKDLDATKQTMTPEQAVRVWEQVPEELRKLGQKKVEVVDFRNPDDPHWAKAYHEKDFRSYATGGDRITFYAWDDPHNEKYMVKTYAHEIGHGVDRKTNLISAGRSKVKYAISEMGKWKTAMRKDRELSGYRSPTSYGTKARAEDFAESIATYTTKREWFKTHFPNRTKIIEEFLRLN